MSDATTDRLPTTQWLHAGDTLTTLGAAVIRVVKTRAGECRLEVETSDVWQWQIARDIDRQKTAS